MVITNMNIVETYHIFVNSSQRQSGTDGNFTFSLYTPIRLKNQNNSFYVRIGSAEIPYTFQLINSSNNTISFTYVRNVTTSTLTITIPPGNYNVNTLITTITGLLTPLMVAGITWNITYNRNTGYITFGFTPPDIVNTVLTFQSISTIMSGCLGYASIPLGSFGLSGGVAITITSTQNVNLSQINALYIRSENIKQLQNFESIVVKSDISDILAKIQIAILPMNMIEWINPTDLFVKVSNKFFDNINLYVTNNLSYDDVTFNGLSWSCRITIQEVEEINYENDKTLMADDKNEVLTLEKEKQDMINKLLELKQKLIA